MSKLTLSVVSMTAVLGLSPLFSTAQAFEVRHLSCDGHLVSVAAIAHGHGGKAEIACYSGPPPCIGTDCPVFEAADLRPLERELRCSTTDPNLMHLANVTINSDNPRVELSATPYGIGHKYHKCTRLVVYGNNGIILDY